MIAALAFRRPGETEQKRFKGLLKYLQYRSDRDGHIPQEAGKERWVDCGLGNNFQTISMKTRTLESHRVGVWTLVLSPAAALMEQVAMADRQRVMLDITERFMSEFFAQRGFYVPPEYSFVVHHKDNVHHKAQDHAHVVIAATSASGFERVPFENRKPQLVQMRAIADRVAGQVIEQYVQEQARAVQGVTLPARSTQASRDLDHERQRGGRSGAV
jgi:hypothetical protein